MSEDHPTDGGHDDHQTDEGDCFLGAHDAADHQHVGQAQSGAGQQQRQSRSLSHAGA